MKIAIIGSRGLFVDNLGEYIPNDVTEIVSGGAKGIDSCAREYAVRHNIKLIEHLPEYEKYGRYAPLRRNVAIVKEVDVVYAFWDGSSKGTKFVIDNCNSCGVPVVVIEIKKG